jgi:hypothetical protein
MNPEIENEMWLNHPAFLLNDELRSVLIHLFKSIITTGSPASITLAGFLGASYARHPEKARRFFENPEKLEEFNRIYNIDLDEKKMSFKTPWEPTDFVRKQLSEVPRSPNEAPPDGVAVPFDPMLTKTLLAAGRIAAIAGRKRADLADIIEAISVDHEATIELLNESGLRLKE